VDNLDHKALGQNFPPITPAGLLLLDTSFDVLANTSSLQVNSFQSTLSKGRAPTTTTFATITAQQKFTVPLAKNAALPPVSGNLATIDLNGVPLDIAQVFLPANLKFTSGPLKGQILLAGAGGTEAVLTVHTTQPITVENVQFSQDGVGRLSGVKIIVEPEASWKTGTVSGNIHVQATSAQGSLLDTVVNASQVGDTLTAAVTAHGTLTALAAQPLGADWRNLLADPKPEYSVTANFTRAVTPAKTTFTLSTAEASVVSPGGAGTALADVKLIQPFNWEVDAPAAVGAKAKYVFPKLNGDVASIKLTGLPAGVLALATPGYHLQGQNISADVAIRGAGNGSYTLVTNSPIMATGLSVATAPVAAPPVELVRDLTFSLKPAATFSSDGLSACSIDDLTLSSGQTALVGGNVTMTSAAGSAWPTEAKINMRADLAALLHQPVLLKYDNLTTGLMKLDGALETDGTIHLDAEVSQWTVRDSTTPLPDMVLQGATGKLNRDTGALQLTIPIKGQGSQGNISVSNTLRSGVNLAHLGREIVGQVLGGDIEREIATRNEGGIALLHS